MAENNNLDAVKESKPGVCWILNIFAFDLGVNSFKGDESFFFAFHVYRDWSPPPVSRSSVPRGPLLEGIINVIFIVCQVEIIPVENS